jgi:DNA polymerase III subunit epsilon
MRLIFLDTETTGLNRGKKKNINSDHRIIEVAAIEMVNGKLTGEKFHSYINPGIPIDEKAFKIHGIDNSFLLDKPKFAEIAPELFEFLNGATVVMHNADFDIAFINGEIEKLYTKPVGYCYFIDTLSIARKVFPGDKNTLDSLAERFGCKGVSGRVHGALKDAQLLSEIYPYLLSSGEQRE